MSIRNKTVSRVAGDGRIQERALKDTDRETGRRYKGGDAISAKSSVQEIERVARDMVATARNLGYKVTADNLEFYLDGKGIPKSEAAAKKLPRRWLRCFKKVLNAEKRIRGYCEKYIAEENIISMYVYQIKPNRQVYLTKNWYIGLIDYKGAGFSNEELFFASGNSYIKAGCFFTIDIKGKNVTVSGYVRYIWHDTYDFHNGLGVFIPGFGHIPDAAMKKLCTHGKAKEYELRSVWHQRLKAQFTVGKTKNQISWNWGMPF
jgi:hypothetical protein